MNFTINIDFKLITVAVVAAIAGLFIMLVFMRK